MRLTHMFSRFHRFRTKLNARLLWDIFMVYLAFINLGLILFDLTYLWLRPTYFRLLPVVTRTYDPVKGIESHPLTERYLDLVARLSDLVEVQAPSTELQAPLAELRQLSRRLLRENPFERSGQTKSFIRLVVGVQRSVGMAETASVHDVEAASAAFDRFWSLEPDRQALRGRLGYFERELRPLLEVTYYRSYELNGQLTDHFWWLDLPFLAIFTVEFGTRWILALRRGTYARWFFFPIVNWYDLLGIIPLKQFRLFRLFRIASIYVRLHRSEHIGVGEDVVSRTVKYFANIISEEITDMVALRILNETQEEIRDGTHQRIIRAVAEPHREALAAELTARLQDLLMRPGIRQRARHFLEANLERAVESAEALRRLPLPDAVLRPLVATVGRVVFDSFADTLTATLSTEEGREALEGLIADVVEGLVLEITEGELETLVREVSLQVIDHMKQAVGVRKWALPDSSMSTQTR